MPPLVSKGNKPLEFTFEQELLSLILFHLEEHQSGLELLQFLDEDEDARAIVGTPTGVKKSTFYEAINTRGLTQMAHVFDELLRLARKTIPSQYKKLGKLVAIDGSLINASPTMDWADYRNGTNKAKAHVGFDINRSIPMKIHLNSGKSDERPYMSAILEPGQTGVTDRYYQCYDMFDTLQKDKKHYICRIKENSRITPLRENAIKPGSPVFYDVVGLLGTKGVNQTKKQHRVVAYTVDGTSYRVATDRFDLASEDIMAIYKLRWNIETFFGWWKQHLNVYHRLARGPYGMMVQVLAGLITYLLLAIYCRNEYDEPVSIKRVRQLRNAIRTESRDPDFDPLACMIGGSTVKNHAFAKT